MDALAEASAAAPQAAPAQTAQAKPELLTPRTSPRVTPTAPATRPAMRPVTRPVTHPATRSATRSGASRPSQAQLSHRGVTAMASPEPNLVSALNKVVNDANAKAAHMTKRGGGLSSIDQVVYMAKVTSAVRCVLPFGSRASLWLTNWRVRFAACNISHGSSIGGDSLRTPRCFARCVVR